MGAIVAIGANGRGEGEGSQDPASISSLISGPLECVEIAGCSLVERLVEQFIAIDVDTISVLMEAGMVPPRFRVPSGNVTFEVVSNLRRAIHEKVLEHAQGGIQHTFVQHGDVYTEADLLDLFCFHREARQAVTGTRDKHGALALWVVNGAKAESIAAQALLENHARAGSSDYFIRDYVSRLNHPREIRQFASDMLTCRCEARPSGTQVRTGVWMDEGAEVHRRARVVGPAYMGGRSTVEADALITRCSTVESDSCVECGTVVEDSSVLAATRVGIGLDLCHAVANGNRLLNLRHDVVVEVSDPKLLRSTLPARIEALHNREPQRHEKRVKADLEKLHPMDTWQFDHNLIQE
jgi:carbonic anhydrase/acetyltransferase-like protein (isoleucine patch superfamily)